MINIGRVTVLNTKSVVARDMIKNDMISLRSSGVLSKVTITRKFNNDPMTDIGVHIRKTVNSCPVEKTHSVSFDNNEQ